MTAFSIRSLTPGDREWVDKTTRAEWGAEVVVVHGTTFRPSVLPGFIAEAAGQPAGLLTYFIAAGACEVVTLNSWREGLGVGSALLEAAKQAAGRAGCRRLFLVTTNNNLHALRFYQKRGLVISAVRLNAVAESRKLKPEIPLADEDGLPIRDEIELEIRL
jgi:ribosomal protein S18 acetylase RimI-like enzyme